MPDCHEPLPASVRGSPGRALAAQRLPTLRWLLVATALPVLMWSAVTLAAWWTPPWPLPAAAGLLAVLALAWALVSNSRISNSAVNNAAVNNTADLPADPPAPHPVSLPTPTIDTLAAPAAAEQVEPVSSPAPSPVTTATPELAPSPAVQVGSEGESFAYTVSHDLRAPIRVIEGFTRIVREDYGHLMDRVGNDHLDRVLGAAARMNHMIDALLALAKLSSQPLTRRPVDLSRLAAHVLEDLAKQAPQRLVEWRVAPGIAAQGDPTLMRLVLENLLGNAWKYSARREPAQIEFGVSEQEGRPAYFVSDNGAGFDMRFADRLFGPFQRLHSASEFQGTGVGLASVQRIIRRHGGDIWAEAEVDRGATFYFTLG